MTRGMRSSEFWLTVIGGLVTAFQAVSGSLDPRTATYIGAGLTAVYTIVRGIVKATKGEVDPK